MKKNKDNDFNDNKITNLDKFTVNIHTSSDNELSNKIYVDDSIGGKKILGFNQALQNYLKVSIGKDIYNINKYDKKQIFDITVLKLPNSCRDLPLHWVSKCNNENNISNKKSFKKSTKTTSPTENSGTTSLQK